MTYLIVTGGAGFIGTHLIEKLLKETNYKLISLDNYSSGSKSNHIKNRRVKYLKGDTKNIHRTLKSLKKKINTIFHFGEFSRIAHSFKQPEKCFSSNILGSLQVINFCLKNKIKIVYSATSASLGNNENDRHLSPYAYSKSSNMNLILNYERWFGLKNEIIYFYNVYGPKQIKNSKMSAVFGIFEQSYINKKPIPVVMPGSQTRRFTHVDDTVQTCYNAWKKNKNRHYAIINTKSYSIFSLARLFKNDLKMIPERPGERFESKIINSIRGKKIHNIYTKDKVQKYIKSFKQSLK